MDIAVVVASMPAERITTGNPQADPRLVKGRVTGLLTYDLDRQTLAADRAQVTFPGAEATLALRGDIAAGAYAIAGPVTASRLAIEGAGDDARAQVNFSRHGTKWLALSVAKLTPIT